MSGRPAGQGGRGCWPRALCTQAQGLPLWDRARKSHLQEGELNGRNPRKGREGIGAAVHGQWPDPGEGQEGVWCGFRVAHVFPHRPRHTQPSSPARPHLHLGFPAVVGDHHLLVEGLPTRVGRVHLGAGLEGHWSGSSGQQLPFIPAPGPALACFRMFSMRLMRRGLVLETCHPLWRGRDARPQLGTQGQGAPDGSQVMWHCSPLTQHCACPGSQTTALAVQHAGV